MKNKTVRELQAAHSVENTTYNVIDTLIHLNKGLWIDLVNAWSSSTEAFIVHCWQKHSLQRQVAYTYWHAIWFAMEHGYPLQFHPGNDFFRRNPDLALDALAGKLP
jgi:hypothetical protein